MKKNYIPITVIIAIASILLASCSNTTGPGGSGGANATTVVNGTITVANSSYWSNVKIGVFSGGTAGVFPELNYSDNSLGVSSTGLYYWNTGSHSTISVPPLGGTSYSISGSGATLRNYSFELPSSAPAADTTYYYAAWYDGTANGSLDLIDCSTFDDPALIASLSEYNRLATKSTTDNDGAATILAIVGFFPDTDISGNLTGNYKYSGHDDAAVPYNEILTLDTSTNNGFNFTIAANSGW